MNAIQIWVMFCIVMVFLALLEYGLILWIKFKRINGFKSNCLMQTKPDSASTKIQHPYQNERTEIDMKNVHNSSIQTPQSTEQCSTFNERIIDKIAIIVFPISFVVFNIVHWITYI
jgi:hypothetical protein